MSYVELHAASAFSFLEGASRPEDLVSRAKELGLSAIALVDRDGVYGAPRFHMAAKSVGLQPHLGAEISVEGLGSRAGLPAWMPNAFPARPVRLPLLVESRTGYQNLCRLITLYKLREKEKGTGTATLEEIAEHAEGLVCLTGGEEGVLAASLFNQGYDEARKNIERLTTLFGRKNVYVELQRHCDAREERRNQAAVRIAETLGLPLLATNGVRYAGPTEREILDVFTCIRNHCKLETAGRLLERNDERHLRSTEEMIGVFSDLPEAIENSSELSARLEYTLAGLGYEFPRYPVPEGETMDSFLRKRTEEGFQNRYGVKRDDELFERAKRQVQRELALIEKLHLAGYFLIVWDIVRFCREQNILVQGRGSAANSAVCYSLGITAVDAVGMELLFERFLSEERGEWPDIDLDLPSGDQREKAIQYVYQRYGQLGAAMTANVITYRDRSAAREVGKALGFDQETLDQLSSVVNSGEWRGPSDTFENHFEQVGFDLHHPRVRKYWELCERIQDLPRHLGQHSGGMVVCQGQLDSVVPLEPATMPGRVVVQWDKDDCADMGIVKVDLLGLGMMAAIQDSLRLVPTLDLAHVPQDDPQVYKMLCDAETVGVFQVESRAQMATLPRLKPTCFYDIVVQVAIIRPGPIVGQMVHPYLNRRAGREPVTYPHPSLEPILARTLGVPLFQEQLLRIAMAAAGFTGGQAEDLRRAFGFKRSERRMKQIEVQLRDGMTKQGIVGDAQEEIIRSITSFALYGFPESHAASFALLAYASAYLKVHYPSAFYTALLNNQPMGFYHPSTLVKDAQRRGVRFHPIDVQISDWECTVESDGAIRLGLRYVNGLREQVGKAIASHRPSAMSHGICPKCGCDDGSMLERVDAQRWFCNNCSHDWRGVPAPSNRFRSLDDLVARTGLRRDEVITLADIGALNSFGYDRRSALWQAERAVRPAGDLFSDAPSEAHEADPSAWGSENEDEAECPLRPMTESERLVSDFAGMGLSVGRHPMAFRRDELAMRGILRAIDLRSERQGRRVRVAGMVITRQRPGTAKGFVFLTLEDETGIANIIVRPDLFARDRLTIVEEPFLIVDGVLQSQDGVTSVRAEQVHRMGGLDVDFDAHDFH